MALELTNFFATVVSTVPRGTGKRYVEVIYRYTTHGGAGTKRDVGLTLYETPNVVIPATTGGYGYRSDGTLLVADASIGSTTALIDGDVVMFAHDLDAGNAWCGVNGTWATGDPGTDTTPTFSGLPIGTYYLSAGLFLGLAGTEAEVSPDASVSGVSFTILGRLGLIVNIPIPTGYKTWGEE